MDGRTLGFREQGDRNGFPVFFFHGTPGSRVMLPDEKPLHELKIRMITVDRPGYGHSDLQRNRKLSDWPNDLRQLADFLEITQFSLIGFSGGGPHAMACAIQMKDRIRAIALVSSLAPGGPKKQIWQLRLQIFLSLHAPSLLSWGAWPMYKVLQSNFEKYFSWGMSRLPVKDQEIGNQNEVREIFRKSFGEAFRNGGRGYTSELRLLCRDWGFSPGEVPMKIKLWHGRLDTFQSYKILANEIRDCDAEILDEGHLLIFKYWKQILQSVLT
jgi:pimeloyl-ACP methyl ester carboxylesterase